MGGKVAICHLSRGKGSNFMSICDSLVTSGLSTVVLVSVVVRDVNLRV